MHLKALLVKALLASVASANCIASEQGGCAEVDSKRDIEKSPIELDPAKAAGESLLDDGSMRLVDKRATCGENRPNARPAARQRPDAAQKTAYHTELKKSPWTIVILKAQQSSNVVTAPWTVRRLTISATRVARRSNATTGAVTGSKTASVTVHNPQLAKSSPVC
ncbi:hypothetical protein E4U43_002027 [Claviceps pusilla]|uniref:Uncharacterized protein n=1 Tax=Claviceps pusilla TaxID=123648 RepID=A0A9P7N7F2_9HYPO|nr:hypothetical protein E4U43_002027 [Claviceps pusilla]